MKHKRFFSILAVAVILSLLMVAIPAVPASAADPKISLDVDKGEPGDLVTVSGTGFRESSATHFYYVYIYFSREALDIGDEINYYNDVYWVYPSQIFTDDDGDGDGEFSKVIEIPAVLNDSKDIADVHGGTYYFYATYGGEEVIEAYIEFTVIGITDAAPDSGPVGTEVEISGVGFDANDDIQVLYDGGIIDIISGGGDRRFKPNGSFTSRVEIPESTAGEHTLAIEDDGGHSGQVQFTVESQITLSPIPASAGDELTITGTGFDEDSDIFVYFDGEVVYIIGDYDTNDYGGFESSFIVPEVEPGTYLVEVEDNVFNIAQAQLEVGPDLVISPVTSADTPGNVGDTVELSGGGFQPSHEITITYASDPVTFTTDSLADGSFEYSFAVPPSPAGEHIISVSDEVSTKYVSFFVESTPPEAPALLLPEMDTKASSEAEFDWTDVSDASLPMTYELQVATNSQFTLDSLLVNKIGLTASTYTLTDEEKLESTGEDAPY
ncbi:MAG: IPT/TIG domain-containing protein, partial [Dehalococcoidia bacterium]|nr:IPT/TIG domain-containing protein [Dehalococcoidia bacterium]